MDDPRDIDQSPIVGSPRDDVSRESPSNATSGTDQTQIIAAEASQTSVLPYVAPLVVLVFGWVLAWNVPDKWGHPARALCCAVVLWLALRARQIACRNDTGRLARSFGLALAILSFIPLVTSLVLWNNSIQGTKVQHIFVAGQTSHPTHRVAVAAFSSPDPETGRLFTRTVIRELKVELSGLTPVPGLMHFPPGSFSDRAGDHDIREYARSQGTTALIQGDVHTTQDGPVARITIELLADRSAATVSELYSRWSEPVLVEFPDTRLDDCVAMTSLALAMLEYHRGAYQRSSRYCSDTIDLIDVTTHKNVAAQCHFLRGKCQRHLSKLAPADPDASVHRSLALSEYITAIELTQGERRAIMRDLRAKASNNAGYLYYLSGHSDKAMQLMASSAGEYRHLVTIEGQVQLRPNFVGASISLTGARLHHGASTRMTEPSWFKDSETAVDEARHLSVNDVDNRVLLAKALANHSVMSHRVGEVESGLEALREAIPILGELQSVTTLAPNVADDVINMKLRMEQNLADFLSLNAESLEDNAPEILHLLRDIIYTCNRHMSASPNSAMPSIVTNAHYRKATVYRDLGRYLEALTACDEGQGAADDRMAAAFRRIKSSIHFRYGMELDKVGRKGDALSAFKASAETDRTNYRAWYNIAVLIAEGGVAELEALRKALIGEPELCEVARQEDAFSTAEFHLAIEALLAELCGR